MQKLSVKIRTRRGKEKTIEVTVIRSWQDASGQVIYLHSNGTYGYKTGAPVRSKEELNVIPKGMQHKAGLFWWDQVGKTKSKEYYAAEEARLQEVSAAFAPETPKADSELDMAMYFRKKVSDPAAQLEGPLSWMAIFQQRPDWWGEAKTIELGDYAYQRSEPGTNVVNDDGNPDTDEDPDDVKKPDVDGNSGNPEDF